MSVPKSGLIPNRSMTDRLMADYNQQVAAIKRQLNKYIAYVNSIRQLSKAVKTQYINAYVAQTNATLVQLKAQLNQRLQAALAGPVSVSVAPVTTTTTTKAKTAVTIGINYSGTSNQLSGCIHDAHQLKQYVETQWGFSPPLVLTDESPLSQQPTKRHIVTALTDLLDKSNAGDVLFFSYSGHGSSTSDVNRDELDGQDEMIIPIDATTLDDCILDDELNAILRTHLKANVMLFCLFDCCFSGTVLDLKYNYLVKEEAGNQIQQEVINSRVQETKGQVIMISGCSDQQTSADAYIDGNYAGAMTYALLTTLQQHNHHITYEQLLIGMRNLLANGGYEQIPQLSSGQRIIPQSLLFSLA